MEKMTFIDRLLSAFSVFSAPPATTAANPGKRCRCGMGVVSTPSLQAVYAHIRGFRPTTTAANPGKRCRCGMGVMLAPSLQAVYARIRCFRLATTAANSGKRCRCGDGRRMRRVWEPGMVGAIALVAVLLTLFPVVVAGQNTMTVFSDDEKTQGYERIGTAMIECTYRYAWLQDTVSGTRMTPEGTLLSGDSTDISDEVMLLQCGGPSGVSRFYSYSNYYRDSLITSLVNAGSLDFSSIGDVKGGTSVQIFKNWPKAGRMTMIDKMLDWFEVEESVPDFGWKVCDEWNEMLGYRVRRAECSFRGRDYVAWFAPELPVSEGPWKFCGLPGLVMHVYDTECQYVYMMTGIRQVPDLPVMIPDEQYVRTDLRKYYRTLRRYIEDPIGFVTSGMDVTGISITDDSGKEIDPNDPKLVNALRYRFQEIVE